MSRTACEEIKQQSAEAREETIRTAVTACATYRLRDSMRSWAAVHSRAADAMPVNLALRAVVLAESGCFCLQSSFLQWPALLLRLTWHVLQNLRWFTFKQSLQEREPQAYSGTECRCDLEQMRTPGQEPEELSSIMLRARVQVFTAMPKIRKEGSWRPALQ